MASPEAGTSCVKLDVVFFSWVWLIMERRNVLCMRKLLRAKSFALEVKNECVEAFMCIEISILDLIKTLHKKHYTL